MKIIKRKTNVRQHGRITKNSSTTVKMHERNLKPRRVMGIIPLKNLKYNQAKAIFPTLEPNGDIDGDGVVNRKDCRPFDIDRQDDVDSLWDKAMKGTLTNKELDDHEIEIALRDIEEENRLNEKLKGGNGN